MAQVGGLVTHECEECCEMTGCLVFEHDSEEIGPFFICPDCSARAITYDELREKRERNEGE